MSTGKDYGRDYGLPEEYHGWVLTHTAHGGAPSGEHLRLDLHHVKAAPEGQTWREGTVRPIAHFTPPKLPEPQPVGTVIGYTTPVGYKRRAIRNPRGWDVYGPEGNILCNVSEAGMHRELQHATTYTVLVGGFEEEPFSDGHSVKDTVDRIANAITKQGGIGL